MLNQYCAGFATKKKNRFVEHANISRKNATKNNVKILRKNNAKFYEKNKRKYREYIGVHMLTDRNLKRQLEKSNSLHQTFFKVK